MPRNPIPAAAVVNRYAEHPADELYDLTADAFGLNNLATDPRHAPRLVDMCADLDAWMEQQIDAETFFGQPLPLGEPVTSIVPGNASEKAPP